MADENFQIVYPGWEVVRKIGGGSYGTVYEIRRELYGKTERAALKHISIPHSASELEELQVSGYTEESITAHFKSYLADVVKEYLLMAELKGYTNIVCCDDVRQVQKESGFGWDIYIRMELLTPLIKTIGKELPEEEIIKLGRDLCAALAVCRKCSILHRDIKPQNILVSRYGDYKLGDFGIAKIVERTSGGTIIGTYDYMAPEVYNKQPYGYLADIYSVGMVLYWLLNERRGPFVPSPPSMPSFSDMDKARERRFAGEPLPPPANGSEQLKRVVLKACAFDPKQRYQSPEELSKALERLSAGTEEVREAAGTEADKKTIIVPPKRLRKKLPYLMGACAVLVILLGIVASVSARRENADGGEEQAPAAQSETVPTEAVPTAPSEAIQPPLELAEDEKATPEAVYTEHTFASELGLSFRVPDGFSEEVSENGAEYTYTLYNEQLDMRILITEIPFEQMGRAKDPDTLLREKYESCLNTSGDVQNSWKNNSWNDRSWRKSSYDLTGFADEETIFYTRLYNRSDEIFTQVQFLYPQAENAVCDELLVEFLSTIDYPVKPSDLDIRDLNELTGHSEDYVEYPSPADYFDGYETMYASKGTYYYRMARTDEKYKTGTIDQGTEVTVLAKRNSRAFVVFVAQGSYNFGWCYYPLLKY